MRCDVADMPTRSTNDRIGVAASAFYAHYAVNAKQKCPLFAVRAFLFFEKKNFVAELWGYGREARECGQPVGNAAAERPVDGDSSESVVHGLSTRPEGRAPVRRTRPQIHSASAGARGFILRPPRSRRRA